ncbi:MAG: hypothetical protein NTX50_29615 [Candidatus Sumerlaeota bacterium]|nr:hypothetical protein [Candidatus Sumerlaeota bacterium]
MNSIYFMRLGCHAPPACGRVCETLIVLLLLLLTAYAAGDEPLNTLTPKEKPAQQRAPELEPGANTLFLLQADAAASALVDRTGRFKPVVAGGAVIQDAAWGPCLKFGDGDKNGITLKDDGKISFEGGVTLDAWIFLEEAPSTKGAPLALKVGSFAWELAKGKLNTSWLVFPSAPIFTTTLQQFKYFPVGGEMINGLMQVPLKKWTRLTVAYDEALGAVTTRIDSMTDRYRYRYRGPERMQCDGRSAITLLQDFKNCRIGALRINTGRPRLVAPSLEVYVNPLPFQDRVMITFDHIDPDLPLPIETVIVWEKASGEASVLKTFALDSHAKKDVMLDLPTWKNSLHTIMVNATADGRAVFSKSFRIANVKPEGAIKIGEDRALSKDGKKFFPLMAYHSMPEDFPLLAGMGFNVMYNDFNLNQHAIADPAGYSALLTQSLDAAQKNNLLLWVATNSLYNKLYTIPVAKAHPALLGWYGADEPWGDLTRLAESYNTIKMLEPNLPVIIIQNNYSRLQDTAPGADIIGVDPYPIPNVSLRAVADATQAAVRAVSGRKPVWTILPQYETKIPTREELRCMAWLAIVSGADGVGFFDWDERVRNPQTKAMKGWYTREHPEQVENLRAVLKELRALEPVLLTPCGSKQPALTPGNPALHALVKEAGGKRYLLIASDSRRAEEATLKLESAADAEARCLCDGGSNANLRFMKGELQIKMPPFGAAVYDISMR